jgi:hypothetical protein
MRPETGGFWVKNFCRQGALLWHGGFQQDFRLFSEKSWLTARIPERDNRQRKFYLNNFFASD